MIDREWEFLFLCGLGTVILVAHALASILRYPCSSRAAPATLRVPRVRPIAAKMSELTDLTLLSPGSRIVALYTGEADRFLKRTLGWLGPTVTARVGRALVTQG